MYLDCYVRNAVERESCIGGDARNSKSGDAGEARILFDGSPLRVVGWAKDREIKKTIANRRRRKSFLAMASSRLCLVLIGG